MQLFDLFQLLFESGKLRLNNFLNVASLHLLPFICGFISVKHSGKLCKHATEHGVLLLSLLVAAPAIGAIATSTRVLG